MIKPEWLRKRAERGGEALAVRALLRRTGLATVCEEARCPNLGECFSKKTATFMILGEKCSRNCGFCAVTPGKHLPSPDPAEPENVARAAAELKLSHVVITSVTRDDLEDGGAVHFAKTVEAVRDALPEASIEVLTPDFLGKTEDINTVIVSAPDVYNHNMETVPELYKKVRPAASYKRSLSLLELVKQTAPSMLTKSGIMLGLGETEEQVGRVMDDLANIGCDALTIGQYLRPALNALPVAEYVRPEVFERLKDLGESKGIKHVFSGPYVRSSYHAGEVFKASIV